MAQVNLRWQSKLVLLLVLPYVAVSVFLMVREWWAQSAAVSVWTLALSAALGLLAWTLRAATPAAALTGAVITASLMFTVFVPPFQPWRTGLVPVVTVLVLTSLATRFGRRRKERLGTAEKRRGRAASQVAANLGLAALVMDPSLQSWLADYHWTAPGASRPGALFVLGLAALAEAAADTISSEIGQVLGGEPRMITTFRRVEPGTDGAVTMAGTTVGVIAAGLVAAVGGMALNLGGMLCVLSWAGGVFGLLFDSLLGATLERAGLLNNDSVNFLSTVSAAGFGLAMLIALPHP